jgi:hypothetical protein
MRPAFFLILAATLSFGQSANTPVTPPQVMTAQRQEELVLYQMQQLDPAVGQVIVQRRQAAYEEQEFCRRANRVAELWVAVMHDHYDGRANTKKMRELSKAFHALEKSGGWITTK